MSESAEATVPMEESASTSRTRRSGRSRRNRRRKANWSQRLWIALGCVFVLAVICYFGLQMWLKTYIKSEKFRNMVAATLSEKLNAKGQIEKIDWDQSLLQIQRYTAQGYADAPFAKLSFENVRADVDLDFWKRTVRVDSLSASRVSLVLSDEGRLPRPPQSQSNVATTKPKQGFFEQFAPNKFRIKEGRIDELSVDYQSSMGPIKLRGLPLQALPTDSEGTAWEMELGTAGAAPVLSIPWEGATQELEIQSLRALVKQDEFYLRSITANFGEAQLTGEATYQAGAQPHFDFDATVTQLEVEKWIKEDWVKKLGGQAKVELHGDSNPKIPGSLVLTGSFDLKNGVVQNLPALESLADYLGDRSVLIMKLTRASFDFTMVGDEWTYKNIYVESEGTLRVEGVIQVKNRQINGTLAVGVTPKLVKNLPGAEKQVFIRDEEGYRWTNVRIGGTVDKWTEDLTDQLTNGAINQGINDVTDVGIKTMELAPKVAGKAMDVATKAPDMIQNGLNNVEKILDVFNPFQTGAKDEPEAAPEADPKPGDPKKPDGEKPGTKADPSKPTGDAPDKSKTPDKSEDWLFEGDGAGKKKTGE